MVLVLAMSYTMIVSADEPTASGGYQVQDEPESIGHVRSTAVSTLRRTFYDQAVGAVIGPDASQMTSGEVYDASYNGKQARMLSLSFGSNVQVHAVRPASAGALLARGDLDTYLSTTLSVMGARAMYSAGGGTQCVHFEYGGAVWCVTAQDMSQEGFLQLISQLRAM